MEPANFERAADLRARKSTTLYWLERLAGFGAFLFALWLIFGPVRAQFPGLEKFEYIPVVLIAMGWAWVDNEIRHRYGRRKRWKEVEAEMLAEEAGREAGRVRS
jgi:uncharacterized membrane protein